jgi:hypothetical protein
MLNLTGVDFNTQAGIVSAGFVVSLFLIGCFGLFVFQLNPACGDDACFCLALKWFTYKYCRCCCKSVRTRMKQEIEQMEQEEELK